MPKQLLPSLFKSKALDPEQCPALLSQGVRPTREPLRGTSRPLLLSRSRYRVRTFPMGAVPRADRRAALRNLLLGWSPFDDADYSIAFVGDNALAFAWDRRAAMAALEAAGLPSRARPTPEGLFRPVPLTDGIRLHACLEGFEAQVWRDGVLVESRWWPQRPSPEEWDAARRSRHLQGTEPAGATDAATPWQSRPWTSSVALDELDRSGSDIERLLVLGLACGFVGLAAMQARDLLRAHETLQQARQQQLELTQKATPIAAARAEALGTAARVKLLSDALSAAQPLEVLQHLAEQLPKAGVTLRELDLRGQNLRLTLELAPMVQRSDVLKGLQSGGWFVDVSELREGATPEAAVFEMRLASVQPGAAAAAVPATVASQPGAAVANAGGPGAGGRP